MKKMNTVIETDNNNTLSRLVVNGKTFPILPYTVALDDAFELSWMKGCCHQFGTDT